MRYTQISLVRTFTNSYKHLHQTLSIAQERTIRPHSSFFAPVLQSNSAPNSSSLISTSRRQVLPELRASAVYVTVSPFRVLPSTETTVRTPESTTQGGQGHRNRSNDNQIWRVNRGGCLFFKSIVVIITMCSCVLLCITITCIYYQVCITMYHYGLYSVKGRGTAR